MKNFKVCFEVRGLAVDDERNPAPAGICLTLENLSDENYDRVVACLSETEPTKVPHKFPITEGLLKTHEAKDFRWISEEEYERQYGNG